MTTQKDLAQFLSKQTGFKESIILDLMEQLVELIIEQVSDGKDVTIRKLGTFYPAIRKERIFYNMHTKSKEIYPKQITPRFKSAPTFKSKVSKRKDEL